MPIMIRASLALLLLAGSAQAQTPSPAPEPQAQPSAGPSTNEAPRLPGPAKSARFRLQVGRVSLGLTCPDDEPLKACADFAMQLLDKAESMQKR